MCYLEGDEPYELLNEKLVTARKSHKCSCCRRTINPKESYLRHFSKLEGTSTHGQMCNDCHAIRAEFHADPNHNIHIQPSELENMLIECIAEGDEDSELKWKPMLEQIRERRELTAAGKVDGKENKHEDTR